MTNWLFSPDTPLVWRKWLRVMVATMEVIRLPATGPIVQNPMAVARPSWGLKSRTSAGVATSMAPSTNPRAQMTTANCHWVWVAGTPNATSRPMISRP